MYPTSEAYKTAIAQTVRDVKITGTITLKAGLTVINISDADIVQGSLYFTEQCVSGEDIEIGNVYASEMGLTLTSPPENPYALDGARIVLNFGINTEPDPEEEPIWEYVPLGYFYVTEIQRKNTAVNLKALDGLILFDVDLSGVLTTGTPYSLIQSCCTKAGVVLATSSSAFENFANGLTAFTIPDDSKIETCRDLILWVCQLTGTFARMNRMGQLEIVPITMGPSLKSISKQVRLTSDVSDFEVKITHVNMKVGETEYSQGTAGMTLTLEENPLLAGKSEAEINAILSNILNQVTTAEYVPYNVNFAGDPALQAGDWVKLTGVSNINGPEFVYTRNSVAYHPDTGEEIPADTPIYVDFAAGKKGSLMEEGTTNLLTANQSSVETDTTGFTTAGSWLINGGATISRVTTEYWHGTASLKVDTPGAAIREGVRTIGISANANTQYTFSVYVKATSGTPLQIRMRDFTNSVGGNPVYFIATGSWQRVSVTITTGANAVTDLQACVSTQSAIATTFYIDGLQIEQKPYATSFTDGTRAAPLKRITLPEALPEEFGVGVTMKMLWGANDPAAGDYRRAFDIFIDQSNRISILWWPVPKRWAAEVRINNVLVSRGLPSIGFAEGDIVALYFERRVDKFRLTGKFAGGEIASSNWVADDRQLPDFNTIYVGCQKAAFHANAVLADFVLHDRPEDIDPEGYLSAIPGGGGE